MKIKPNESAMTAFSKHFKRIFGGNTTFGEIAKVKQNSDNLMGNHVAEYLKDQSDFIKKQQGDI
jgi:uncharacterized membrane protein